MLQRNADIIRDLQLGITAAHLARRYNVSRQRISEIGWAAGIHRWRCKIKDKVDEHQIPT